MSDELEARMWDDGGSRYESRGHGAYFESAFASSEHLDRAPLLSEETYTDVPVTPATEEEEHCHWRPQAEPPSAVPQLLTALVLCGFFMVCELIGGYLAGSLSVMSDAAHMLSDCGGFALALLAFHCAKRQPDVKMSYGYKRAEVLGAMVSVLLIWILTGVFVYVAAVRLHSGEYNIEPDIMMVVSGCGVAFNVVLALVLHGCASDIGDTSEVLVAMVSLLLIWIFTGVFVYVAAGLHLGEYNIEPDLMMVVSGCGVAFNVVLALVLHGCASDIAHHHTHGGASCSHSHAHAHAHGSPPESRSLFRLFRRTRDHKPPANGALVNGDYTMKDLSSTEASVVGSQARNINLRAALIHVIGDLIQSCGVLLASILIKIYPSAKFVDPVCTFVFSILVLCTSARVVRDALAMLMQAVPPNFRYREVVRALGAVSGVRHVHSLHAWALATHHTVLTAHVAIDELTDPELVLRACQQVAREYGARAATVQVERFHGTMMRCDECRQVAHQP